MSVSSIPGSQAESQEWIELPLLELIEPLESGSRPKGGVRGIDSGIPSVGGEHLTAGGGFNFTKVKFVPKSFYASMRRGHIRRGDILIVKDGATTGKVALVRDDFPFKEAVVNEHVFIIRPKSDHDCRYIFWYLHSKEGQERVLEHFQGAAQGGINQQFAPGTLVPIPPTRDDEAKISAQIEGLVEGLQSPRDRLATIPALLKKFRQSVLAAACSGQLTADWRGSDDLTGWVEEQAQEVCDRVQSGSTPREGFLSSPGVPFLKVYNIVDQKLNFDYKPQFVSEAVASSKSMVRSTARPGDVLMNIVGPPLGKVAVVSDQYHEWTFNQALTLFRPSERVTTEWLYVVLCSGIPYEEILMQTRGSAGQSNISLTQCREMVLPVPPVDEQVEIVRSVESLFALADSIESRLAEATAQVERTTQAILGKAFRGELEVDVSELPEPKRITTSTETPLAPEQPTEQVVIPSKMKTSLKEIVQTSNQSRFDPEQLRTLFSGDYDSFRDELFALLSEPSPILRQHFDESTQRIQLVKE